MASRPRNINHSFSMASPNQSATIPSHQRKNMARRGDITLVTVWINSRFDGMRAIMCGNTCCHPLARLNRHRKGCFVTRFIAPVHHRQPQRFSTLSGECQTNQAAPIFRHEIDRIRGCIFGHNA